MIETEIRGPLNKDEFESLKSFLSDYGEPKGYFDRISIDYSTFIEGVKGRTNDIRVRVTNNEPELIYKSGSIGTRSRKEIGVKLKDGEFPNAIQFMEVLGYKKGMAVHRKNLKYIYKQIEFSLNEVPNHSFFYEAEKMSTEERADGVKKEILDVLHELNLRIFSEDEFDEYVDILNKEAKDANKIFNADQDDIYTLFKRGEFE